MILFSTTVRLYPVFTGVVPTMHATEHQSNIYLILAFTPIYLAIRTIAIPLLPPT